MRTKIFHLAILVFIAGLSSCTAEENYSFKRASRPACRHESGNDKTLERNED